MCPTRRVIGSILIRRSRARRRRRSPAPRAGPRRAPPRPPRDDDRERAAAVGREVVHLEVLDVDALGAERLEDARRARPAGRAGGRAGAAGRPDRRMPSPASGGGCPPPRRSSGRAGRRPRRSSAGSSCSIRRRCSPSAATTASRLSRKMSTQIRGFAPAMRVMSRSEPPAAWSGSWPSIRVAPAWLRRTFASACGKWLVTATRRSWAPASIATGRAPSAVTNPCTVRSSSGPVPAVGVRNQVAPSNSSAFARSGPRVSAPQIGWPPMKRPSPSAAAQTALFVEPTSVTRIRRAQREHLPHDMGSSATGLRRGRGRRRRQRRRASRRARPPRVAAATREQSGSGSQPRTVGAGAARGKPCGRAVGPSDDGDVAEHGRPTLASARRPEMRDRATGGRSGGGRRASRTGGRAAPRALPRSRRGTPSRPRP